MNFVRPGSGHAEIFNYLDRVSGVTVMTNVPPPLGSDSDGDHTPQVRNRSSRINEKSRPVGFPTVNPQLQKERDSERREILQNELEGEQQHVNLALARKEPANVIHRHLENITALKRELSHLRSN
ncbi:hypothetical protein ACO0KY_15470 [Undibacterium sp. Dicai25W]|uniref:hypothetical protein n=1 Tax=Undibacterium sp. Dicai25W TaxID=3413034 RepID=UPI003BF29163